MKHALRIKKNKPETKNDNLSIDELAASIVSSLALCGFFYVMLSFTPIKESATGIITLGCLLGCLFGCLAGYLLFKYLFFRVIKNEVKAFLYSALAGFCVLVASWKVIVIFILNY